MLGQNLTDIQKNALEILNNDISKYILLYGGSRSGKTYLLVLYIAVRCLLYPGSRHIIARYSFANAKKTTWLQTVLPIFKPLERLGLCKIKYFDGNIEFKNGSFVILGGLEPHRIDGILGGEYATIFIDEANENRWAIIEQLFTRLNSNAKRVETGRPISTKFLAALNPTTLQSWDYKFFTLLINPDNGQPHKDANKIFKMKLNPIDNASNLSSDYLNTLESLSDAKKKRFYFGEYHSFEGLVYQVFNPEIHIIDLDDSTKNIIKDSEKIRSIDFGYIHPFVCLFVAFDSVNDRFIIYNEIYLYKTTVSTAAKIIKEQSTNQNFEFTVSDHDAEDRATLHENGIATRPADKSVQQGIDLVIEYLEKNKIYITRNCQNLINEFYSYRWDDKTNKDRQVIKENDDGLDALRYAIMSKKPSNNWRQATLREVATGQNDQQKQLDAFRAKKRARLQRGF